MFLKLFLTQWSNFIAWNGFGFGFLRYWVISLLQLFFAQYMTSQILKLSIVFLSNHFLYNQKFPKKKDTCSSKQKKRTSLLLFYIRICVSTKFQLELTILFFSKNFTQKRYFLSKTEKSNLKMKFWMIKLVYNHWKNLRLTLVFMWSSALREVFNFCFSRAFC